MAKKPAARKPTAKPTPKKPVTKAPVAKKPVGSRKFIRNAYQSPFRIRLERHGKDGKPINLSARGQRGDLAPIERKDLTDPDLQANVDLGAIEIITEGEALAVVHKQTTNQQAAHPALSSLRNELGEQYKDGAVKVTESNEDQGVVVAETDGQGNLVVDREGIRRVRQPGEAPGSPEGAVGAERTHAPANEDAAYLSDQRARQKNQEGPEAGLGGIKRVVVAEPTKGG